MKKTVKEKLQTKLNKLQRDVSNIIFSENKVLFNGIKIFSFSESEIKYGTKRVSIKNIDPIYNEDYEVTILLSNENLSLLGGNLLKPPYGAKVVFNIFKEYIQIKKIIIGSEINKVDDEVLYITKDLYLTIVGINREEGRDKTVRVKNRTLPFLKSKFNLNNDVKELSVDRDYNLLLQELIASNSLSSNDIVALTSGLIEPGDDSRIVIKQEIHKQTEWLLKILRKIIDEPKLGKTLAKKYGKEYFNYPKSSITGPEHLLEKILTDYGKNILFGVPALLNTNKYVMNRKLPRVQFDLLLIDSLSDLQIVELKRTDVYVLDYDSKRNKFYPSKELSVAIGQSERYITTLYKDNDLDFKIGGKTIKQYIEDEVGGTIELNITRPDALIIIGAINRLAKDYNELPIKERPSTEKEYMDNLEQAYRELRNTHKNIKIITYSELIESAELRLKQD